MMLAIVWLVSGVALGQSDRQSVEIQATSITLPEPILASQVGDVRATIESVLGGLSYRQFARDSVVAPVRIKLQYIRNEQGVRVGHLVHLAMIAHVDIAKLKSDSAMTELFGNGDEDAKLSQGELEERGVDGSDDAVRFRRLQFELLERIELECVLRIASDASPGRQRLDLQLDDRFDNRWKGEDAEGSYEGFAGWLHAARVEDGAVFIEARFAFTEPEVWFRGSNFLRSKLPLALQETAREFRRRLKKQ